LSATLCMTRPGLPDPLPPSAAMTIVARRALPS
jgi:hypothetical protein